MYSIVATVDSNTAVNKAFLRKTNKSLSPSLICVIHLVLAFVEGISTQSVLQPEALKD